MKRRTKRHDARVQRRLEKEQGMKRPGGSSRYAKKSKWLAAETRRDAVEAKRLGQPSDGRVFGFQVSEPKPWRSA